MHHFCVIYVTLYVEFVYEILSQNISLL